MTTPRGLLAPEIRSAAIKAAEDVLKNESSADSLRVSAGICLLQFIGNEAKTGLREVPNPLEHDGVKAIWRAMFAPLQRLAVLAEQHGLDSTPLRANYAARHYEELDHLSALVDRLEIIECGPATSDLLASLAILRGTMGQVTIPTALTEAPQELRRVGDEPPTSGREWIRHAEAARQLMHDLNCTFGYAKVKVTRAARAECFVTNGRRGRQLRIEQGSFNGWRIKQRDEDAQRPMP